MRQTKICSGPCGKELPISAFGKKAGTLDGLQYSCKQCHNQQQRKYNQSHSKILKGISDRHYQKNRDKILQRAKRIYLRNVQRNKGDN